MCGVAAMFDVDGWMDGWVEMHRESRVLSLVPIVGWEPWGLSFHICKMTALDRRVPKVPSNPADENSKTSLEGTQPKWPGQRAFSEATVLLWESPAFLLCGK